MLLCEKGLDSRKARSTCRRAWPPTPSLSDKSCLVAVWARRPWRGKHFIKLKCFWDGGTETRGQCSIHRHQARSPLPGLSLSAVLWTQGTPWKDA